VPSPNRDILVPLASKFHCIRLENCGLLGYYAASNGNNTEGRSSHLIRGGNQKSCIRFDTRSFTLKGSSRELDHLPPSMDWMWLLITLGNAAGTEG
jgi:hypothetical protein